MPRHDGLPNPTAFTIRKSDLLKQLSALDADKPATERVLKMEVDFRKRITQHVQSLPTNDAQFSKFNTNPFVLMIHSLQKGYRHISQIENDILPAKVFSSMETSAGRMVETVVLPIYGWQVVPSEMHTANSVLDGKCKVGSVLRLATLKSGPRCLNDEMSENLADAILTNFEEWAKTAGVKEIEFTYGVLYGTKRQSNKKDWHILRNIKQKLSGGTLSVSPDGRWDCKFTKNGIVVTVTIRIGIDLWNHFGETGATFMEMCSAIIRACISPSDIQPAEYKFTIADLPEIISLKSVSDTYNVSLLQRSQLEWLFFFARHFCDELREA
jgi:Type II restriction endonuclease EcoO109I